MDEDDRTPLVKPSLSFVKKKWETHQVQQHSERFYFWNDCLPSQTPAALYALMRQHPWATVEETGLALLEKRTLGPLLSICCCHALSI